nr:BrnT family toxin [uncultured Halomonas sp.]
MSRRSPRKNLRTFLLWGEDNDHGEARFLTLGLDGFGRLLVVVYTYREPDEVRVISARRATPKEYRSYQGD